MPFLLPAPKYGKAIVARAGHAQMQSEKRGKPLCARGVQKRETPQVVKGKEAGVCVPFLKKEKKIIKLETIVLFPA